MKKPSRASPCCNVTSQLRNVSLETKEAIFRCTKCGLLRIESLRAKSANEPPPGRRLRLVVSS